VPAESIASDDDTHWRKESDGKNNLEHNSVRDIPMQDDMVTVDGVDVDCDVHMEIDAANEEAEDEEEEDEKEEDKEKDNEQDDEEENEHEEEENEDEDDGNEPRMIDQREMVIISTDNLDTMVDDQPIVLPE
jgi:hypothetical protein